MSDKSHYSDAEEQFSDLEEKIESIFFFGKILFFELLSKNGFYGHHNLEIFVGGLKNTVFQICSFPLQEWCIIYRRTYLRQKYGDMLEKGVPPCTNYQQ